MGARRPETAAFRCPHCKALIDERHKARDGQRRPLARDRAGGQGHAGFRLNALVSLLANASWAKLAAEFLAAKDDPPSCRPSSTRSSPKVGARPAMIDEGALAARAEPLDLNHIPAEVLVVTVGV